MNELLLVRSTVLSLLEKARGDKWVSWSFDDTINNQPSSCRNLKSALEAKVTISLPCDVELDLAKLLRREGAVLSLRRCNPPLMIGAVAFLKTLFIVSEVELVDAKTRAVDSVWTYSDSMKIPGADVSLNFVLLLRVMDQGRMGS